MLVFSPRTQLLLRPRPSPLRLFFVNGRFGHGDYGAEELVEVLELVRAVALCGELGEFLVHSYRG